MSKRKLRSPFFVVNPKAYLYGEKTLELARKLDQLAEKYEIDILFTTQFVDAYRVAQETSHLVVTVQHMDGLEVGRGMGYILPEALAEAGVEATFLNHAEHPVHVSELVTTMKRADELDILTIVCADSVKEAQTVATLGPDVMVCEPTELIGSGQASDSSYMQETNQAVKQANSNVLVLQAAGISTVEDVRQALESGADGTGGTSGIIGAEDPVATVEAMLNELVNWKRR